MVLPCWFLLLWGHKCPSPRRGSHATAPSEMTSLPPSRLPTQSLTGDIPPALVSGSILPITKCRVFIPVLGKSNPPCTSGFLSREVEIPWWCLGPACSAYISFCCKQLRPGPSGTIPQSFTFSSAPGIVQHLLEGTGGAPCAGGYQLRSSHGSTTTSSVPSCSVLTKASHRSCFEMKMLGLSQVLCSV